VQYKETIETRRTRGGGKRKDKKRYSARKPCLKTHETYGQPRSGREGKGERETGWMGNREKVVTPFDGKERVAATTTTRTTKTRCGC
jgi:hypothetical protein